MEGEGKNGNKEGKYVQYVCVCVCVCVNVIIKQTPMYN
jgi:hypothetical protein